MKKEIISTGCLYKASFYLCWGAEIIESNDSYPHTNWLLQINPIKKWLAERIGLVSWKKYRNWRKHLKQASLAGIYIKNRLGDNATVR